MRKTLFLIVIAVSTFASCKKEDTPQPGGPSNGTVSKIKDWTTNTGQTTYIYDGSGKCVQYNYSTGGKVTHEFAGNKLIKKQYNSAGINDFTTEFELNGDGQVIKESRANDPNFDAVFIYNSDKQAVKKIYHQFGSTETIDYYFTNGNCDSTRHHTNGTWKTTVKFTYYTDKPNTIGAEAYGMSFFGKENKNLIKTEQYFHSDGSSGTPMQRTYEFDAAGRVIKQTTVQGANTNINYITYY